MKKIQSLIILFTLSFALGACSTEKTVKELSDISVTAEGEAVGPDEALLIGGNASSAELMKGGGAYTSSVKGNGKYSHYTVKPGDTLMKIAFETYGDVGMWKAIKAANPKRLKDGGHLEVGMVLRVEEPEHPVEIQRNGEKFLIQKGHTLNKIAKEVYGAGHFWKKLWENNKQLIKNPNLIFAGFILYYIPSSDQQGQ